MFSWLDLFSVMDMRSVGVFVSLKIINWKNALLLLNVFNFLLKFFDGGFENFFVNLGELLLVTFLFNKHAVYDCLIALAVDRYQV